MPYGKFIRLIEDHADQIAQNWILEVKNNPATEGYSNFTDEQLGSRVTDVFYKLGKWLEEDVPAFKKTAEHFMNLGRERATEGLKASEVVHAILLARIELWKYFVTHEFLDTIIELNQALSFYQRINNFFDKALYYVTVGFESLDKAEQERLKKNNFVDKTVKSVARWIIKPN
jgi:hypothetical protein